MKLSVSVSKKEQVFGAAYLVLELFFLPSLLVLLCRLLGVNLGESTLNLIYFSVNFLSVLWIFRKFLAESGKNLKKQLPKCLLWVLAGFFLYQASVYLYGQVALRLQPNFSNVNDGNIRQMLRDRQILLSLALVIMVPITEECLFRGMIFGALALRGRPAAYGISALLFASIHVIGYIGSADFVTLLLCYLQYLPAGLCLCLVYEKSDNIFAPVILHMTINLLGVLIMNMR